MNKKQKVSIAVVVMSVAFLAMTRVTANSGTSNTPLYTFRMEQASSGMSFLPTTVNEFSYDTRDGYTLNWEFFTKIGPSSVFNCRSVQICPRQQLAETVLTCRRTCFGYFTCSKKCVYPDFPIFEQHPLE